MEVPQNSGRKYCTECAKKRNRDQVREWYHKRPRESRLAAGERQKEKLLSDVPYRLYTRARNRTRKVELDCTILPEDIIVPDVCPVLKTPFEYGTYYTASLDRIDSTKGYIKGNVQVMSHKANAMKNSATKEELIEFAKWVLEVYS